MPLSTILIAVLGIVSTSDLLFLDLYPILKSDIFPCFKLVNADLYDVITSLTAPARTSFGVFNSQSARLLFLAITNLLRKSKKLTF